MRGILAVGFVSYVWSSVLGEVCVLIVAVHFAAVAAERRLVLGPGCSLQQAQHLFGREGDPMGSCDPTRLGQVLSNLIGNAIQYGDVSGPIKVRVEGNDPETITITVHNLGTPIPMETQKVIFQSWMRGQDVKNPPEQGTHLGLGLYIAKLVAEAHGGDISVTSNEQAGTTFYVRLPRN